MTKKVESCCELVPNGGKKGFWQGILFGVLPHTFCILFVIFSIVGATSGSLILRKFIIVPYLFQVLVAISLLFATLSAVIYLRRNGSLSWGGVKHKWRYLVTLYTVTAVINLLLFYVIIPASGSLGNKANKIPAIAESSVPEAGEQVIEIDQTGSGYSPKSLTVKVNQPVKWIVHSKSQSCASSINAPDFGISQELVPGDNVIEFTPRQTGTFVYSCFMGMYRGTIKVEE